jgi:acyl-CoA thioester hydrolase
MPRLKLELPDRVIFTTEIEVRVTDLNYGNHLANHALLGLLHEVRLRWLHHYGFKDERDVGGAGIIQADAAIVYRNEAFGGDLLAVELFAGEMGRSSMDLFYRVQKKHDRMVIAEAKTHIAFFDYSARRLAAMPATFRACLEEPRGTAS